MVTMKDQYPTLYELALEAAQSNHTINSTYTKNDWHNAFVNWLNGKSPDYLEGCENALLLDSTDGKQFVSYITKDMHL